MNGGYDSAEINILAITFLKNLNGLYTLQITLKKEILMKEEKTPIDLDYWAKEGPRTACFLLIIPGITLMGVGIGMVLDRLLPYSLIGLGLSCTVWGLIVVFRKV